MGKLALSRRVVTAKANDVTRRAGENNEGVKAQEEKNQKKENDQSQSFLWHEQRKVKVIVAPLKTDANRPGGLGHFCMVRVT